MQSLLDVGLALGDLVGGDPRRREQLHEIGPGEVLQRPGVGDLVDAAAHEQVPRQGAGDRVVDHLVHLQLAVARARLEEEVVGQVLDEISGGEHVVTAPGLAHRILDERARAPVGEVLGVPGALHAGQVTRLARRAAGRAGQHRVDRRGDELDVPELLGRDAGHEVIERPGLLAAAEVKGLERVVHEGRHLAELAAQELLDHRGADRIGLRRRWQLRLKAVKALNHE